ncbi:hypothetical protein ACFXON_24275 [Bacillus subtilis]
MASNHNPLPVPEPLTDDRLRQLRDDANVCANANERSMADELLTARTALGNLRQTMHQSQVIWDAQHQQVSDERDTARAELQQLHNDTQQHYTAIAAKQQRYSRDHDIYRGALRDAARMLADLGVTNPPPR